MERPEVRTNFDDISTTSELSSLHLQNSFIPLTFSLSEIKYNLENYFDKLPEDVKSIVIPRVVNILIGINPITLERIYTADNIGNIWTPSIKEITNNLDFSDANHEENQYKYFKELNNKNNTYNWWTRSAMAFRDNKAYMMIKNGFVPFGTDINNYCSYYPSLNIFVPLCLRLKI